MAARIILGVVFLVVIARGIILLAQPGNGSFYPIAVTAAGSAGCLLMIFWPKRRKAD